MEIVELKILRKSQQIHFPEELQLLSKSEDGTQVKKSSNLRKTSDYFAQEGSRDQPCS